MKEITMVGDFEEELAKDVLEIITVSKKIRVSLRERRCLERI